jgi:hypothetical protein
MLFGDKRIVGSLLALAVSGSLGSVGVFASHSTEALSPAPAKLKQPTLDAFQLYVQLTDARNAAELKKGTDLLWVDLLPGPERAQAYVALKRGEVEMKRLETRNNGEKIHCPGGLIHHWAGVAFIPGAKLEDVLSVLKDYDHHAQYYAPDVERSRIESHDDDHFVVFLRFRRHKVITVVLDTEHDIHYFHDSVERAHSRSSAIRIAQVENPGKPEEHEKPPGDDDGFLWRMETWWRMEERDGGVYVQSEVVSLTRDIPIGLGWLIGPFVTSIPKESLTFTLEATRKAWRQRIPPARVERIPQATALSGAYLRGRGNAVFRSMPLIDKRRNDREPQVQRIHRTPPGTEVE